MAKKTQLGYQEIETRLRYFHDNNVPATDVPFRLLYCFGKNEADIRRWREGKGTLSAFNGLLIKGMLCYRAVSTVHLVRELESLKTDAQVVKAAPKIVAVCDGTTLRAYDMRERETYENSVARLYCDFNFFYPLMDVEKVRQIEESPADVKAAEKLAKLHDEIRAYNEFTSDTDLHDLNIFISRLLFCFFAEDTGIFSENLFTNSIAQYTLKDGSDLSCYLAEAFAVMDVPERERKADTNTIVGHFPYVNGGLFSHKISIPSLSARARRIMLECGELDWQDINPDIFGSMIQAVVNPEVRANQGMHYTSVPNILKVINPLFLDELRGECNKIKESLVKVKQMKDLGVLSMSQYQQQCKPIEQSCTKLLKRMAKMKFFDPACGSGNFLIITYKNLRLLEMEILDIIRKCNPQGTLQFIDGSVISIKQFYGIELLDFPHEIAMLSLWLAEHQMNKKLHDEFGVNTRALPLTNITQIKCGNACRLDWNVVCPHEKDEEVFVFGNPPYLGSKIQSAEQKRDIEKVFGDIHNSKILDYIGIWFFLGAKYISNTQSKYAFVSTNSICQGEQVGVLWPEIFKKGIGIQFAYTSFKWTNNAKHNAAVICVIIGLETKNKRTKYLFTEKQCVNCDYISPYLTRNTETIVKKATSTQVGLPKLAFGCMPYDAGNLLLDKEEYDDFVQHYPNDKHYLHRIYGAEEFINDKIRYCLWIDDNELNDARKNPEIRRRIDATKKSRVQSKDGAALADKAHQFREHPDLSESKIIVPSTSSERRPYIPIGYLGASDVISNSAFAIYDAPIHLFGILTSRIHMDWVRAVGGRLKTDYRYSAGLCYNTFPFPKLSPSKRQEIEDAATNILMVREEYLTLGKTLADLYDPDTMPDDLKQAHAKLDDIVESCYPGYPFPSDEARLECLFKMYEKMTKTK